MTHSQYMRPLFLSLTRSVVDEFMFRYIQVSIPKPVNEVHIDDTEPNLEVRIENAILNSIWLNVF